MPAPPLDPSDASAHIQAMTGYLINKFDIVNRPLFDEYVTAVTPIIAAHGGEVIIGNNAARSVEGAGPGMIVVIAFPTEAAALGFYESPEYQPVKTLRLNSTTNGHAVVLPAGITLKDTVAAPRTTGTAHLDAYLAAMGRRDVEGTKAHMADDVVINSPIVPAPLRGKAAVAEVLAAMLGTVDAFEPKLLLRHGDDFVAVFTIRLGEHVIDGMDHMHLNAEGLVDRMTVAWRPLPAVIAVQQQLAPKLGGKPMMLVPIAPARD